MIKHIRETLIVGGLTVFSIVGAVLFMHTVRKGVTTASYSVWAVLPSADGLYHKSRVMIAGIIIGEIKSISLHQGKARIDMRIRKDVELYKNATIAKLSLGLLGDQVLVLTPGDLKTGFIGENGQITEIRQIGLMSSLENMTPQLDQALPELVKLSRTLGDLSAGPSDLGKGSFREIASSLRDVAQALSSSLNQNQDRFNRIIMSVERITNSVANLSQQQSGQITEIIKDIRAITGSARNLSLQEDTLRQTLQNVLEITKQLRNISTEAGPEAKKLYASIAKLEQVMASVQSIGQKIDQGKGSIGRLINDDQLVRKVEGVVMDVNDLVKRISLTQVHVQWRADYYFQRANFRNALQLTIQPSPQKYYTIALIDDPRGLMNVTRRVIRSSDPRQPEIINEEQTVITDSFRFSLQLNYRLWLFALRGGIIENSAGFGIDFFPYKDYIQLQAELFDIGLENLPRLRLFASFNFLRHFTISGGVDDLLNSGSRDFFVGAGLRFTDDDLKYVLSFIPIPK